MLDSRISHINSNETSVVFPIAYLCVYTYYFEGPTLTSEYTASTRMVHSRRLAVKGHHVVSVVEVVGNTSVTFSVKQDGGVFLSR